MAGEGSLAERLARIISEQQVSKSEFARSLGVSRNYVYVLASGRARSCSRTLALLIEKQYGYRSQWLLTGQGTARPLAEQVVQAINGLDEQSLSAVAAYVDRAAKGQPL
ncbi:MAG: helix-turn-helix domain-containing protein [Propionibacteriaceae bacterium]|jgi:plasmid maintenance system antidote protein VapI|nr:helix-turn-helix domain-containing protein [Propionibacteriaceae bacterium]